MTEAEWEALPDGVAALIGEARGVAKLGMELHKRGAFWDRLNPESNAELLLRLADALETAYQNEKG